MVALTLIILALLSTIDLITGNPIALKKSCNRPLFSVVGKHYSSDLECDEAFVYKDESYLIQKYQKYLSGNGNEMTKKQVKELLGGMLALLEPRPTDGSLICTACQSAMATIQDYVDQGKTPEEILELVNELCTDFNVQSEDVCRGMIGHYGPVLTEVILTTDLSSLQICSFIFDSECGIVDVPEHEWDIELPDVPKPPLQEPEIPPEDAPKLKVLHLSDIHYDALYSEGSWAECGSLVCCHAEHKVPDENASVAGLWGGWKCDSPERTIDNLLEHLATEHKDIDYIIWTGDLPAHDLWEQNKTTNLNVLKKIVGKIADNFPSTPIFPALGNHESVPANMYIPPAVGGDDVMDWLYSEVAEQWKRWIPESESETVRYGGFYSTLVRPGLRIVSMNMNYCYNQNWWLMLNSTDPAQELKWLLNILQTAESNNEKVHIIGHVPAGHDDCLRVWQRNFYKILNRYEATLVSQFYGHTHNDEFEVFYDLEDNSRPIGVAYIGPSVTTYTYLNPGFRIYYVDGDREGSTRMVLDHETWILDLEKANREDNPVWTKMYSAKETYGMTSLLPSEWDLIYQKLVSDDETMQLYHRFYWKDSPRRPDCDESCKKRRLCDIRSCIQYQNV